MPRSHKTPGRRARDVARAQRSRAIGGAKKALRDSVHVSRRSQHWTSMGEVQRARRKKVVDRFQKEGRAGSGQRKPAALRKEPAVERTKPRKRKAPTARGPQRWPGPGDVSAYGPMLGAGKTRQARVHVKRGR